MLTINELKKFAGDTLPMFKGKVYLVVGRQIELVHIPSGNIVHLRRIYENGRITVDEMQFVHPISNFKLHEKSG
jgi:hypothetical protein